MVVAGRKPVGYSLFLSLSQVSLYVEAVQLNVCWSRGWPNDRSYVLPTGHGSSHWFGFDPNLFFCTPKIYAW
jgi:hypothetical protein